MIIIIILRIPVKYNQLSPDLLRALLLYPSALPSLLEVLFSHMYKATQYTMRPDQEV